MNIYFTTKNYIHWKRNCEIGCMHNKCPGSETQPKIYCSVITLMRYHGTDLFWACENFLNGKTYLTYNNFLSDKMLLSHDRRVVSFSKNLRHI